MGAITVVSENYFPMHTTSRSIAAIKIVV